MQISALTKSKLTTGDWIMNWPLGSEWNH